MGWCGMACFDRVFARRNRAISSDSLFTLLWVPEPSHPWSPLFLSLCQDALRLRLFDGDGDGDGHGTRVVIG